jgi:hypothetical protein
MNKMNLSEQVKVMLQPKASRLGARLFMTRDDGITIFDSIQNDTTTSVAALVSGVWQASEALMGLVKAESDVISFRLGFDTSSEGIFLVPLNIEGKRYFLGAIYTNKVTPGVLKRQVAMIKNEFDQTFEQHKAVKKITRRESEREGFLFQDISDAEIDRLFSLGGV